MVKLHVLAIIIYVSLCLADNGQPENLTLIVQTNSGRIRGILSHDSEGKPYYSFYGIPFARPPVGNLRFKDPVPLWRWKGVRDGTKEPPPCIQPNVFLVPWNRDILGQEDCLFLNVFSTMPEDFKEKLPVVVCIHVGAFEYGSAALCGPRYMMRENVVFVSIQYRLNIFGFLSTEDDVLPGNMGLKDQTVALSWVKKNIESFGGDPGRVTIMGYSAGGASVHFHVLSPKSTGLFRNAISKSGNALCPWSKNERHLKEAKLLGRQFKCFLTNGTTQYLECLQQLDAVQIAQYFNQPVRINEKWGLSTTTWTPRVDGDFIPDAPEILLKEGKFNKVNLILGITKHEGGLFAITTILNGDMLRNLTKEFEEYGPISLMFIGENDPFQLAKDAYNEYLKGKPISPRSIDQIEELYTDRLFAMGHNYAAFYHAKYGKEYGLYLYEFTEPVESSFMDFTFMTDPDHSQLVKEKFNQYVTHGSDSFLSYNNDELTSLKLEKDIKMSKLVTKLWGNFAKNGNPNDRISPNFLWERTFEDNFRELRITKNPEMVPRINKKEKMEFWSHLDLKQNKLISSNIPSKKDEL